MNFKEIMCIIQNKPYFYVNVISHGRIIKKFVQVAGGNENSAEAFFLISKELKSAWFKPFNPLIDGLKFTTYVDLINAIPLKFEKETKYVSTNYITKTIEVTTISEDTEKQKQNKERKGKENDGMPERLTEIPLPPTALYQTVEANFITKILTPPADKFDLLKNKWLIIIVIGLAAFWFMNGGHL